MKLVIIFIILSVILLLGILILMKPSDFNSLLSSGNSHEDVSASMSTHHVPKEIIILGSIFIVTGLVGLAILGFILFRLSKETEKTME